MATPFDRLMNTIRPHLPGAIDDATRQELFIVCQEFLSKSDTWKEDIEFTLAPNAGTADIMPYAGRINRLLHVTKDGRPVRGAYYDNGLLHMPFDGREQADEYVATVALTVTDPVTRDAFPIMPYELVEQHLQTLIHGILKNMMAQPAKPYTNLQLATYHNRQFNGGWQRAKNEAKTGHTMGSQRWRFPQNFTVR